MFAYIFAVLVHHNTAVGRQYGLRHGKQPVGVFGHRSVHVVHFFAHLQKHLFTCGECRLIGMLLEYEQVAAHLDTACLHEKSVRQTYCADKVGMVHQILTYKLISCRVGHTS